MDTSIVKQLRDAQNMAGQPDPRETGLCWRAADMLELLFTERDRLRDERDTALRHLADADRERDARSKPKPQPQPVDMDAIKRKLDRQQAIQDVCHASVAKDNAAGYIDDGEYGRAVSHLTEAVGYLIDALKGMQKDGQS